MIGVFSRSYFSVGGHTGFPSTTRTKLPPVIDLALSNGLAVRHVRHELHL